MKRSVSIKQEIQIPKRHGIVHSYKSNTSSSKRTAFAMNVINESIHKTTTNQNHKTMKGLKHVVFVDNNRKERFATDVLGKENTGKKIFFSAKKKSEENVELGPD